MFYHASLEMTVNFIQNWKVENLAILIEILLNLARLSGFGLVKIDKILFNANH